MKPSRLVAIVALLAAASVWGWRAGEARQRGTTGTVVAVIDGDTVEVDLDGRREIVRLLGIDTPETVDPDRPVECFGPEASAFTTEALASRRVRLAFDAERRDTYGRLLALVFVDGELFNERLLREGRARLLVIPPNGSHGRAMLAAALTAREERRGLWGACSTHS